MRTKSPLTRYLNRTCVVATALLAALLPVRLLTHPDASKTAGRLSAVVAAPARRQAPRKERLVLAAMRERVMTARPLAMYYSTGDSFGLDAILQHASDMTVLAPQCYWLDRYGRIQGSLPAPVLEATRQARLPVMALLYNRGFSRQIASALLKNRRMQRRVIREMADIASRQNLVGFQLDLENIDPNDENLYSRFVRDAARKFHHDGRLLSVAVVPRFLDSQPGQWSAAYDYPALSHAADFLTLMAYDNSGRNGPPGPIAGYDWVRNAVQYARRRIPPNRLLLGIALYGREWTDDGRGFQARTMPYPETRALLQRLSLRPRWDEKQRSPWFEYRTGGTLRSVWYENARSIQEKLKLMQRFHLRGFSAWRLGVEDPRIWPLVSAMRDSRREGPRRHPGSGF